MSVKSIIVTTLENAGLRMAEKGATKAIRTIPEEKQNIVMGGLFVAGTLLLIFSGLMFVRRKSGEVQPHH
jgi:hypothetical protein